MVIVYKQIVLLSIAQQADAEESVVVDIEGRNERWLHSLDGGDRLDGDGKTTVRTNGLKGLAIVVKTDAGEQRGMGGDSRLNGTAQTVAVKATVQYIYIR